ncbi:MAG: hypothetical protein KKF56_05790 [Nanoarchaeota archaeon]|nr:hypothetical protein [Nanoarchaeota archaeon]
MADEKIEKKEETKTESSDDVEVNHWKYATYVLGVLVVLMLFFMLKPGVTGNVINSGDASTTLVDYLNGMTGGGVTLVGVEDQGNLYEVTVNYQGGDIPVFITKDGKYFISNAQEIGASPPVGDQAQQQAPQDIPKSDKPVVELFVMTHCPYGTQAEKGMIPAIEALGDDVDFNIRFVHYYMHEGDKQEPYETPRQVCIREEQGAKYNDYLMCFLEDGDSERCVAEVKVNKAKLDSCVANKAEGFYADDSALSQGYGVGGSPTLVINGVQANSGRDSASYLATICSAMNEPSEACDEVLSSAAPSPGFGYNAAASGGNTAAQC